MGDFTSVQVTERDQKIVSSFTDKINGILGWKEENYKVESAEVQIVNGTNHRYRVVGQPCNKKA